MACTSRFETTVRLVTFSNTRTVTKLDHLGRALRKGAQVVLTPQASARHFPIQEAEAKQLMYDFMRQPKVCRRSFNTHPS